MTYFPLISFSTINKISILVNNSNFTLVSFNAACYANPGAEKILQNLVHKFLSTFASSNVLLLG